MQSFFPACLHFLCLSDIQKPRENKRHSNVWKPTQFKKKKLPSHKQLIEMMRFIFDNSSVTYDKSISDVSVVLREHLMFSSLYCITGQSTAVTCTWTEQGVYYLAKTGDSKMKHLCQRFRNLNFSVKIQTNKSHCRQQMEFKCSKLITCITVIICW